MKLLLLATIFSASGLWATIDKNHSPFPKNNFELEMDVLQNTQVFTGVLVHQPNTKSIESYCASHKDGGNYVLRVDNGNFITLDLSMYSGETLASMAVNRRLKVEGVYHTFNTQNSPNYNPNAQHPAPVPQPDFDPYMQHPVAPSAPNRKGGPSAPDVYEYKYNCTVFKVSKMTLAQ